MQPEVSLRDAARPDQIIAAILAVTAVDSEGLVICQFDAEDNPLSACRGEVVAARQAAAVLLWAADNVKCGRDEVYLRYIVRELIETVAARPSNTEETPNA